MQQCVESYAEVLQAQLEEERQKRVAAEARARRSGHAPLPIGGKKRKAARRSENMAPEDEEQEAPEDETPTDQAPLDEPAEDDELSGEDELDAMDDEESAEESDSVEARFQRAYAARIRQCRGDRFKAMRMLNREKPGLVQAYREAKSAQMLRRRRLQGRR